jgi:hypothetical protein
MHGKILHFFYFVKHMQDLEIYSRTIGTTCDDVKMKIKSQIALWTTADNCKNGGEKCLYTVSILFILLNIHM